MSEIQKNVTNGVVADKEDSPLRTSKKNGVVAAKEDSPLRTPKKTPSIVEPKQVVNVEEVEVSVDME